MFGKSVGRVIGAELQKVGATFITLGIKNVIAGKSYSAGMSRRALTQSLVSIRGNSLRHLRSTRPNSAVVQALSARRKFQTVARIPNAVTPGRKFRGIRF